MGRRTTKPSPKKPSSDTKVTLGDTAGMKHALDSAIIQCFIDKGYEEDHAYSTFRLSLSFSSIALALIAQFYPGNLAATWYLVLFCVVTYVILSITLSLFGQFVERDTILMTKPSKRSMALRVSTTLPRYSDEYTIIVEAADHRLENDVEKVEMSNGVGKYFFDDGTMAKSVFVHDVKEALQKVERIEIEKKK